MCLKLKFAAAGDFSLNLACSIAEIGKTRHTHIQRKGKYQNIIAAVMGLEQAYHILIIDDGSPDGTADIVKSTYFLNIPASCF